MLSGAVAYQKRSGVLPLFILYSVVGKIYGGFDDFFRSTISILSKTELSYLAYLCWGNWTARNDFIFNNKCLPAVLIIEKAQLLMEEFVKAG